MKGIAGYIQEQVLLPRLEQSSVLVVYDPEGRYRELCLDLETPQRKVIDASAGSIPSREAALATLQALGEPNATLEGMLIYVPAAPPQSDEERQRDPFAPYGVCGAVFPAGDGDAYESLCLRAKPDHAAEIRRIFGQDPDPSFVVIDAVGGGAGWPQLQALLRADSASTILFALLAPSDAERDRLQAHGTWVAEARELLRLALGLNLLTRGSSWSAIANELWRFVLFSEFALDLPVDLPPALAGVPHASEAEGPLVRHLCSRLRNDRRTDGVYIERTETVERELNLAAVCQGIDDLGPGATFPFQDHRYLENAIAALLRNDLDTVRQALQRHSQSVWVGQGENQAEWMLVQSTANLIEASQDTERQLPEHVRTQDTLIDYYTASLRDLDRRQREFEQAVGDHVDMSVEMAGLMRHARKTYRRVNDHVHGAFLRHLEASGWPPSRRLASVDIFEKRVAPKLQESGHKVALILIDALRYELGVELAKELGDEGQVQLEEALAQLPTVTEVGMASLLPGAGEGLHIRDREGKLIVAIHEQQVATVAQRMEVLRKRYGQRLAETTLRSFSRGEFDVPGAAELLVIRSNELDSDFESNPEAAPGRINRTFQQTRSAIRRLADLGFEDAYIATDHGFHLNTTDEPGDVCTRPPGNWVTCHGRILLGDGSADSANLVMPAEALGIRGDYKQVAMPRALVAYRAGMTYLHGGASLQEAVVPLLGVRLHIPERTTGKQPSVSVEYRPGITKITTLVPVITVEAMAADLFSQDEPIRILVEAQDARGEVVGEAIVGGPVNPADRTIALVPGNKIKVTLTMDEAFEGPFTIKALDPATLATYASLDLETDYLR